MSTEAQERFNMVLARKTLVLEHGLRPDANLDGAMAEMIAEFYVNAIDRVNSVVQVRGKPMAFDSDTINAYYRLHTLSLSNRYEDLCPSLDGVLQSLCKPGTQWTMKVGTTEKVHFSYSTLSRYGKAWYAFICAKLMPTRHKNDVTKERACLLYGIVH